METLRPPKGATRKSKRLGRGNGSGHGTTAGRGTKGQNSRSGGGVRPGFEGGQMPLYRRVARRGFSNYPFKNQYVVVDLASLQTHFKSGAPVNLESLAAAGLIGKRDELVKILANGEIKKKLKVAGVKVSNSAAEKIVAAGGSVEGFETAVDTSPKKASKTAQKKRSADSKKSSAGEESSVDSQESKDAPEEEIAAPSEKASAEESGSEIPEAKKDNE